MGTDNRSSVNSTILGELELLANRTVDYYLDKDNDNLLTSLKCSEDCTEMSKTISTLLANELIKKYELQ